MLSFALGFSLAVVLMAVLAIAFLNLVVNDGVRYLP